MSFAELKRLNVISKFESKIDYAITHEHHNLCFILNGYKVFVFKCTEHLNSAEAEYIEKHFNDRKSYYCAFVKLEDLGKLKPGFKFAAVYKKAHEAVVSSCTTIEEDKYFIVMKSQL